MGSEWEQATLGELSSSVSYGYTESASTEEVGPQFLRITDIQNGTVDWNIVPYCPISEEEHKKYKLYEGDIVVARTGNSTGENYIFEGEADAVFASYLIRFRIDSNKVIPRYVWYTMRSYQWWAFINNAKTGSAQAGANAKVLSGYLVPLSSIPEQKAIAHILGSLDNKIELNRQINKTLESMAQALFKSWFVDFDPVIDNALAAGNPIPEVFAERAALRAPSPLAPLPKGEGSIKSPLPSGEGLGEGEYAYAPLREDLGKEEKHQKGGGVSFDIAQDVPFNHAENSHQSLFPNEFEYTEEMGWVPKGWEVGNISDIADHIKVNAKAEEITESDMYVGLEHIGRKEIFLRNAGTGNDVSSNKSRFEKLDILFGKLRPYFHKVSIAPSSGICSTDILVFRVKKENLFSYLTQILFSEDLVEYSNMRATGTRMPRANAKDILAYPILKFPEELADLFELTVSKNWSKGLISNDESKTLAKLRDTLLPKLLSGELRIPDTEKLIIEAQA